MHQASLKSVPPASSAKLSKPSLTQQPEEEEDYEQDREEFEGEVAKPAEDEYEREYDEEGKDQQQIV